MPEKNILKMQPSDAVNYLVGLDLEDVIRILGKKDLNGYLFHSLIKDKELKDQDAQRLIGYLEESCSKKRENYAKVFQLFELKDDWMRTTIHHLVLHKDMSTNEKWILFFERLLNRGVSPERMANFFSMKDFHLHSLWGYFFEKKWNGKSLWFASPKKLEPLFRLYSNVLKKFRVVSDQTQTQVDCIVQNFRSALPPHLEEETEIKKWKARISLLEMFVGSMQETPYHAKNVDFYRDLAAWCQTVSKAAVSWLEGDTYAYKSKQYLKLADSLEKKWNEQKKVDEQPQEKNEETAKKIKIEEKKPINEKQSSLSFFDLPLEPIPLEQMDEEELLRFFQ